MGAETSFRNVLPLIPNGMLALFKQSNAQIFKLPTD